ncbi:tyrosine-type recombinase/integrase [Nonomuraea pusilla]|uniref:tyrosine-type recombinase/integrase n=1 Tax=Nonomuraea pusilla TaxID=46177 RepID=UPI00332CFEF1
MAASLPLLPVLGAFDRAALLGGEAILKQAGVRDVRVHDARHTAATLLIEQGVHIRVVQEILGHTRVTTTERYTHVATLQMKDASDRMDSALWGSG